MQSSVKPGNLADMDTQSLAFRVSAGYKVNGDLAEVVQNAVLKEANEIVGVVGILRRIKMDSRCVMMAFEGLAPYVTVSAMAVNGNYPGSYVDIVFTVGVEGKGVKKDGKVITDLLANSLNYKPKKDAGMIPAESFALMS